MILEEALDKHELLNQDHTKDIISQVKNLHRRRLEEDSPETTPAHLFISELPCSKQHHPAADPHHHRPWVRK